jgi:hypothetical protein
MLIIERILEDRFTGNVNKWVDDQSSTVLIWLRDFLNWSTQDSLGIAGILLVGTFVVFMILSYFQKDDGTSQGTNVTPNDSSTLFNLKRAGIVVAMVGIGGLIGYALSGNDKQLRGFLQMDNMVISGPPLLTVGVRNSIRVIYVNRGTAPITGAGEVTMMSFNTHLNKTPDLDTVVFNQIKQIARIKKSEVSDREGATVGIGHPLVSNVDIDFTDEDIKGLMDGTATLYLVGHAYWNEYPGEFDLCFKLKPPKYYPLKSSDDIQWQHCDTKKVKR